MSFSLTYILGRFLYRIFNFFHHWYTDGSRVFFHKFISILESLDRQIAFKITLLHFFQPLYRDYTVIGRIMGVVFRTGRLLVGAVIYLFASAVFAAIYILWLAAPLILILYVLGAK